MHRKLLMCLPPPHLHAGDTKLLGITGKMKQAVLLPAVSFQYALMKVVQGC